MPNKPTENAAVLHSDWMVLTIPSDETAEGGLIGATKIAGDLTYLNALETAKIVKPTNGDYRVLIAMFA